MAALLDVPLAAAAGSETYATMMARSALETASVAARWADWDREWERFGQDSRS